MRKYLLVISSLLALQTASNAFAGDLGINVILSGQVSPGVYGQVEIGNAPRPVVVYEQPRVIVVDKRYARSEPIYLHVPPGHAQHWDKHCREYHACERRVYFVRSVEYDPEYQKRDNTRDDSDDDHHGGSDHHHEGGGDDDHRKHGKGHRKH